MVGDRKRVLVIGGSRVPVSAVKRILKKYNYEVLSASNDKDAVEKAQEVKPDIIILDSIMPGLDSYRISRDLKQNGETSEIPIIFLSGQDNKCNRKDADTARLHEINLAFKCGANDFLPKPVKAEDLVRSVRNTLWFAEITSL
jgi:twitching motility two-component system response regulator PilH